MNGPRFGFLCYCEDGNRTLGHTDPGPACYEPETALAGANGPRQAGPDNPPDGTTGAPPVQAASSSTAVAADPEPRPHQGPRPARITP